MRIILYLVSQALGVGAVFAAGRHQGLSAALFNDLGQYAAAVIYTAAHVFIWTRSHWMFKVGRVLTWAGYAAILALFVAAYFPNGIVPVLLLLISGITKPLVLGFAAVGLPAWLASRTAHSSAATRL